MINNNLTEFNEGGTHSENKHGGIPQGQSSNGQMNTVEQGETKAGQFVYSDRLYINEDLAKQMNLPGYIKGKSFAGASKAINDKFKDRNDIHTKATQKELLDRLAQSQEQLKAEQEAINQSMQINQSEPEYPEQQQFGGGGPLFQNFSTQEDNPSNYTGNNNDGGGLASGNMSETNGQSMTGMNSAGSQFGNYITAAKGTYDIGKDMFGKSDVPTSGATLVSGNDAGKSAGQGALKGASTGAAVGSIIPGVGTVIGAGVGAVVGGVGGFVAGRKGERNQRKNNENYYRAQNFYKYQFNENNDDTQVYAKGGPLDGGNPEDTFPNGIYAYNEKEASDAQGMMYKRHNNMSGIPYADNGLLVSKRFPQPKDRALFNTSEDFDRGIFKFNHPDRDLLMDRNIEYRESDPSYVNPHDTLPKRLEYSYKGNPIGAYHKYLIDDKNNNKINNKVFQREHNLDNPNGIQLKEDGVLGPASYTAMGLRTDGSEFPIRLNADKALESALETPDSEVKPDYTLDDIKNMESSYNATVKDRKPFDFKQVSDKFGNALRYAPVLGNILQKNKIGPAEVESAIKNPYQYKKQYIDEAQYRNAADQQAALSMEALNKSGLSGNQLMAASLGSQLARTKGVAEGAMAAKMHNLNENKIAEQVKQQNEGDFITDSRYVRETNAQNRANRDTQISKFDSEIYNSLGEIGKEETFKKQAEKLTGYKMMGEYIMTDPNYKSQYEAIQKDSKLTPKEKRAMTRKLIEEASSTFDEESYKKVSDALIETANVGHAYGGYMSPKFKKY